MVIENMVKPQVVICDVLRRIIRESKEPEIRVYAAEAMAMSQRMDRKLREYKADYDAEGFWTEYDDNIFKKIGRKLIGKKDPKGN
jgi:hypothetical protein